MKYSTWLLSSDGTLSNVDVYFEILSVMVLANGANGAQVNLLLK